MLWTVARKPFRHVFTFGRLPQPFFALLQLLGNCPKAILSCLPFWAIARWFLRLVSCFGKLPKRSLALFPSLGI